VPLDRTSIGKRAEPRRLALATNYVPEYRFPVLAGVARRLQGWDMRIFQSMPLEYTCADAQASLPIVVSLSLNLSWTTRHSKRTTQTERLPIQIGLLKELWMYRPHVIISGDLGIRSLLCWVVARVTGACFVIWSEDIASSAAGRSRLQGTLRKALARLGDAFLAWGAPAQTYLETLGVPQKRIYRCEQAIDNDLWNSRANAINRDDARLQLNLCGFVYLFVGQLIKRKGVRQFLEAWKVVGAVQSAEMSAVIVGDGDERDDLEDLVRRANLKNVRFVGRQTPDRLATFYAAADVFVFPSLEDVWGLVVNEAMCFGLPILGSRYAGSVQQLAAISDSITVIDPLDIVGFAATLASHDVSLHRADRHLGQSAVSNLTFDRSADAIVSVVREQARRRQLQA